MPSSYTIGKHYEAFVQKLLGSGRYSSASEVMREALRGLEDREHTREAKLNWLRAEIDKGFEGESEPWDPEEVKREGRIRLAARRKSDAA